MYRAAFPLKPDPTGRYLIDQVGRPFLIVGDSPQGLIGDLSEAQADRFFANRQAAGFNAMWINLLCDDYTGCRADGTTRDGIAPLTTRWDLSTPNPAYFARVDHMIRLAAKHGLAVFLDPIETGGWLKALQTSGRSKAYGYGRYLGSRYARYKNIIWLNGNDFQSWRKSKDDVLVKAVAGGIAAADPDALQTLELDYFVSSSFDDPRWTSIVRLNAAYTYKPTYAEVLKAYRHRPPVPVFMIEANYEGEHDYTGPATLRRQEYWSLLSGAAGQFYGNRYTWQFLRGWQSRLDTIGSRQLTFVTNLFARRRWFDLVPDSGHRLVVAGHGTFSDDGSVNDSDYVSAAGTPDGRLALAYLPTGHPVEVDLTRMTGRAVRARWYDPTTGRYATVSASPFARRGRRSFSVPGRNHEGAKDWVLVLTADGGRA